MQNNLSCPQCGIGKLVLQKGTYVQIFEGMLLSAPSTQLLRCDICEYTEFIDEDLKRLEKLIGGAGTTSEMTEDRPQPGKTSGLDNDALNRIKPK